MTSETWLVVTFVLAVIGAIFVLPIAAYLIAKMATSGFLKAKKTYEDEALHERNGKA